jgi:DNA-binding CsgD family transcriptional regulator/PAS domain-containing protein
MDKYDVLVGHIYDCAAAPELWPQTLEMIRDSVGAAYVMAGFIDASFSEQYGVPFAKRWHSPWNVAALDDLQQYLPDIPGGQALMVSPPDLAWTQMKQLPESAFHETKFYNEWVKPNGLRDCANTPFFKRDKLFGMVSAATYQDRALYDDNDRAFFGRLSPHIRRSVAISDIVDKGRLELALYQKVIDSLSVAVFIVGHGRQIIFANEAAEAMLRDDTLVTRNAGALAEKDGNGFMLAGAVEKAVRGDATVGIAGIGVPLRSTDGDMAAAYVLPIGVSDARRILGRGSAAVFITRRGEQQPAVVEILRTVFDLTQAEARVVGLLVQGETPAAIAQALGTSINTTRSHLAQAFAKTGTPDQVGLVALVNALVPGVNIS